MIKRRVFIPIYNCSLIVVYAEDFNDAVHYFNPDERDAECMDAYTVTIIDTRTDIVEYVYIQRPGLRYGAIAHEAKHIVNRIFDNIGYKLDLNNDEAECYLLSYIVDKIIETVRKIETT